MADASADEVHFYLHGQPAAAQSIPKTGTAWPSVDNHVDLQIGGYSDIGYAWTCQRDEVRAFNRALAATEGGQMSDGGIAAPVRAWTEWISGSPKGVSPGMGGLSACSRRRP